MPEPPRPPSTAPFPVVAVVAPMIGAVVIGMVLASPFMLLFAALGPIVAVAGVIDGRRSARRHRRAEAERFDRECALFEQAIDHAHAVERREAERSTPHPPRSLADGGAAAALRIGTGFGRSSVAIESAHRVGDSDDDRRLGRMLARAQQNPELPALIARGHLVVEGSGLVAEVLCRRLSHEPGVTLHRAARGGHADGSDGPPVGASVITVISATLVEVREAGRPVRRMRPEFVTGRQLEAARSSTASERRLPTAVSWGTLSRHGETATGLVGVPIGVGESGVVAIDLVGSGPHALVGGTTGSGKSELLRALALGWAAAEPPSAAQLLFIDFKGGATFARLTELPHCIGLVTDLDPVVAQRAMRSLRAELRHRERALSDAGARDIRERPDLLPRLLLLVDEFATLTATFPELHGVFADIAARGRSLGMHLVLCTQHPASVVRDAIAANCPVRLSFRVTDAASGGIVGERARELIAAPPGRAMLVGENGTHPLQAAVIDDDDIDQVLERWSAHEAGGSTWCPPLPERLAVDDLPPSERPSPDHGDPAPPRSLIDSITFGVLDDPDERARYRAQWHPPRDGCLVVLGASSSGKSTLLAALAAGVGDDTSCVVVPPTLPEAWSVLEQLSVRPPAATLLLCDGLDLLLAAAGDRSSELLARWDSAVRAMRAAGGAAAASASSSSAGSSVLGGRFESRVHLRCADADEHAMAGAPRGLFDRRAPAGRGWWRDLQLQVIEPTTTLPAARAAPAPPWLPDSDRDAIIIAARIDSVAERIAVAQLPHQVIGDVSAAAASTAPPDRSVAIQPRILLATPAHWQSAWSLLSAARTQVPIAIIGCDAADVRSLLSHRDPLPPIDPGRAEFWLAEPNGSISRAASPLAADPPRESSLRPAR
ncbi:FtsK/SpoIIIE domain-containing protein [Microcella sp.]|uniref:FtsK/SpoIIIE domain-containing protein n=1 Tax=Microcella sp. TaxID=1913979 RepID=UPI00256CCA97|nr:FtsK/SpoIIIE domain-containing protein [Microcella sp.]MBX9471142.1 hypothetical protein [Microcella sp.]